VSLSQLAAIILLVILCFQNCSKVAFAPVPPAPPNVPNSTSVAAPIFFACNSAPGPQVQDVSDTTLLTSLGTGNRLLVSSDRVSLPAQSGCGPSCAVFYLFSGGSIIKQDSDFSFDSQLASLSSSKTICIVRTDGAAGGVTLPGGSSLNIGCSERNFDTQANLNVVELNFEYNSSQVVSSMICLNTGYSDASQVTVGDLRSVFGSALTVQ